MAKLDQIISITPSTIELGESVTISYYANNASAISDNGNVIFVAEEGANTYVYTPTTVGQHSISMYLANTITITVTAPPVTVESSLNNLIDTLESNLQYMGVSDAEFDSTTGIIGLADKILNIEAGGGTPVVTFNNLGTEFNYTKHSGGITVNLPSTCTSLGEECFKNVTALKSFTIPSTVTSLGNSSFYGTSLTSITVPDTVTSLGNSTFFGCTSLSSVTLSSNITSIPNMCFNGCSSLSTITLPNGVTSIGQSSFYGCTALEEINLPNTLTTIDNSAFSNCTSLDTIIIPNGVTSIGGNAFYNCTNLTSCTLPNNLTSIPTYLFYQCRSLQNISIPSTVTAIGTYAFQGCGLDNITLPAGLTSIGQYGFANCKLNSVNVPSTVTSIGSYSFNACPMTYGYEFNWTTSSTILTYNANAMPLGTGAKIVVPTGTKSLYTAKSYPSASVIEKGDVVDEILILNNSFISYDGTFKLKIQLINGITPISNGLVQVQNNVNFMPYSETTDSDGFAVFELEDISETTTFTVAYGTTQETVTIDYIEALYFDICDSNEKISSYSAMSIYDNNATIRGSLILQYDSDMDAYEIKNDTTRDKIVYAIPDLTDETDFTFSCEIRLSSTSTSYPYIGLISCPPQSDISSSTNCDYAGIRYNSSASINCGAYRIRYSSLSNNSLSTSNATHSPTEWVRVKVKYNNNNYYTVTWEKLDGTSLKTYNGTLSTSGTYSHRLYGIYFYSNSHSYKAYVRNIVAVQNE